MACLSSFQCLGICEENIFLHDDLLRISDLIELSGIVETSYISNGQDSVGDTKSSNFFNLSQYNAYSTFQDYRLSAVHVLWKTLTAYHNNVKRSSANKRHEQDLDIAEQFSNRLSLLMIVPLIQSQSRLDPALSKTTAQVLLDYLKYCRPFSLKNEPEGSFNGIENLMFSWVEDASEEDIARGKCQIPLSALVGLSVARYRYKIRLVFVCKS